MNRTQARLADGREIFFYDDEPTRRTVEDPREITRPDGGSELRYDPFLDEWVAVAAARQHRTHLPSTDQCPLCPSTAERATEIPQQDYDVVVFENRFPSFSGGEALDPGLAPRALDAVGRGEAELTSIRHAGSGRCEVVCFTPDHTASLAQLPVRRLRTVVDAWADRTAALLETGQVDQVYCFENRGEEIGVTLHHPHGQIYGYPFPTPRTRRMLDSARAYRSRTGGDLFADTLAAETRDVQSAGGGRIVARTEHWTVFVPAWARWPVEVHIYPHRPVRTLPELTEAERDDFAALYSDVLRRGDRLFATPLPYISGWQQAPLSAAEDFRLHLQLFSIRRADNKLKYLAGSESGMGVFINDIPPEQMARRLREAGSAATAATPKEDAG
ncbi:galactose-1-phosphate uridylyltransferase [Nesterenkonia sp.]|uniref:galactose-1-phosphate uridylyltransferase n=1 Tax=Nesterenkonia sp. TaxID=704201 RepID=UPI00260C01F8|nr:galactose-1-phosphate uridylyltransferase [Nesterenkonia sp.]